MPAPKLIGACAPDHIESLGLVVHTRVAVGRAQQRDDFLPHRDRQPVHFDLVEHLAPVDLNRRVPTQQLLDRSLHE